MSADIRSCCVIIPNTLCAPQMLARNGFQDCRVHTPESQRGVSLAQATQVETAEAPAIARATSSTTTGGSHLTLRTKASLLSFGGMVSSLWTSPSPSNPTATIDEEISPDNASEMHIHYDTERYQDINCWVQAAAASTAPTPRLSSIQSSTESTIESLPIATPATSPPQSTASISSTSRELDFVRSPYSPTSSSATPTNATLKKARACKPTQADGESAESLLRGTLRHALSDPSIYSSVRIQASEAHTRPALASIFGPGNIDIAEPARPAPIARPEPKLLRKTASQHTLRLAASPVLSTQEATAKTRSPSPSVLPPQRAPSSPAPPTAIAVLERCESPAPPATRAILERCESVTIFSTPPANRRSSQPRQAAHRNPRDSPVGETRVVKSSPPLKSRSRYAPAQEPVEPRIKSASLPTAASLFDDAKDEADLRSPPRSRSSVKGLRHPEETPSSTLPERPRLRAKESLERILATRERQQKQNVGQGSQKQPPPPLPTQRAAAPPRKALGELSSFHRNALPFGSSVNVKQGSENQQKTAASTKTKHGAKAGSRLSGIKSENPGFAGTLKGLFGMAATSWGSGPPVKSKPAPSTFRSRPTSSRHRGSSSENGGGGSFSKEEGKHAWTSAAARSSMILPTIVISEASNDENENEPVGMAL